MSSPVIVTGWRRERSFRADGQRRVADAATSMRGEIDSHERQHRMGGRIAEGSPFCPAFTERS